MLDLITAGESHGEKLIGILTGMPEGVEIDYEDINKSLIRRRGGYGRSVRSEKEIEDYKILSGIRNNFSTGSPIAVAIINKVRDVKEDYPIIPRPGHSDLIGSLKYQRSDTRDTIERSSARKTITRVLLSRIAYGILKPLGVESYSFVKSIGEAEIERDYYSGINLDELNFAKKSPFSAINKETERFFKREIDKISDKGDTVGGVIQVIIKNPPIGLGDFNSYKEKLDAKIAYSLLSVESVKGISFGRNLFKENIYGSNYHDIPTFKDGLSHLTNNQGGFEGGMTNGEDIVLDVAFKPIPTLRRPLSSINLNTKEEALSIYERSDITQITSAGVILESIVLYEIAKVFMEEIGGKTMKEIINRYEYHRNKFN